MAEPVQIPSFAERLVMALEAAGMSIPDLQRQMRLLGVERTPGYLYNLCTGARSNPTFETIAACIHATDADPRWFFVETLDPGFSPADVLWGALADEPEEPRR